LQPTLKHVSQATIQSKWKTLDESGQAKAAELFRSIALPVLARHANEASKVEAQDAITLVTRSLIKRLPKMPFPPSAKASHLDYDGLAKSNVSVITMVHNTWRLIVDSETCSSG
jgi:kinetochore protein Fta7